MTWSHLHKETGQQVGEPEDASITELTGEAPPCKRCGSEPRSKGEFCEECYKEEGGSVDLEQ